MQQKLKWSNLKINKCPKCDKDFMIGLTTLPVPGKGQLLAHECGFKIFEKRYSEIVNSQVTKTLEDKWNKKEEEATNP